MPDAAFPPGSHIVQHGDELHIYEPGATVPKKRRLVQSELVPIEEPPPAGPPPTTEPAGGGGES